MADAFLYAISGLDTLQQFKELSPKIQLDAVRALNTIARDARKDMQDAIIRQINFTSNYLSPAKKRLFVSQQAKRGSLEAHILARGRPTSLARFITGSQPSGKGVTLMVRQGKTTSMKAAFLIKLRSGTADIETQFNRGLAMRLRKGETLQNKRNAVRLKSGLYILYGPSVAQIVMDQAGDGVAKDLTPQILNDLEDEFLRVIKLDLPV